MRKRQNWTPEENRLLKEIISSSENSPLDYTYRWEKISEELVAQGFEKTPKQCREWFSNQVRTTTHPRIH